VTGLYSTAALVLAGLLLYRFRAYWLGALKRFDAENVARLRQERLDRNDPLAHFKHTLKLAGEQVEEVQEIVEPDERTGDPVARYLFEGEKFATRDEAERTRNEVVVGIARGFYHELPMALRTRRKDDTLH
jgi:hypothetical protein